MSPSFVFYALSILIFPLSHAAAHEHHSDDFAAERTTLFHTPKIHEEPLPHYNSGKEAKETLFHHQLKDEFESWTIEFAKVYKNFEEGLHRFNIWLENHGTLTHRISKEKYKSKLKLFRFVLLLLNQQLLWNTTDRFLSLPTC